MSEKLVKAWQAYQTARESLLSVRRDQREAAEGLKRAGARVDALATEERCMRRRLVELGNALQQLVHADVAGTAGAKVEQQPAEPAS